MPNMGPRGREKRVTSGGTGVHRRGSGLGTGPVGSSSGYSGRGGGSGGGGQRSGGGSPLVIIIAVLVLLLGGGGGLFSGLLGGGSSSGSGTSTGNSSSASGSSQNAADAGSSGMDFASLASLFGSSQSASSVYGTSTGWGSGGNSSTGNTGVLDEEVDSRARAKLTTLKGNGQDTVSVMVYLCGTDLESKYGMGTSDLSEMASATISDKVNVLVYTGGCKKWKNSVVSSSRNQIYQVKNGGLQCLVADDGDRAMTDPATLTRFINWCNTNYPADRRMLIFWDHGGGSITGYGYDEKQIFSDSMDLTEIASAIKNTGTTFDWIGFDACLMATAENALALSPYGDYLLASEETEPGTGWYYTNWLTALSQNTSLPTTELGKRIIDDFVDVSAQKCPGQSTTLSLVDLGELSATLPESFKSFSQDTSELIQADGYKAVATARSNSREFARSSKIDQVDLVDLAQNIGTEEGRALADAILSAVKYNRTSRNMTNAYGLSIYFPGQRLSKVDSMVKTYRSLGLDESYSKCIQQYATVSASGQAVGSGYGNSGSAFSVLGQGGSANTSFGSGSGLSGSGLDLSGLMGGGSGLGTDIMSQIIGSMLSGRSNFGVEGLDRSNTAFLSESDMTQEQIVSILSKDQFNAENLVFLEEDGQHLLKLPAEQWSLVKKLDMNLFYDDGEGYVDLGLDNTYEFTEDGALIGDMDRTWLSINEQPVAYYHLDTVENGQEYSITGRVPALLNGERVDLILCFSDEEPYGYVAGYRTDYVEGETDTLAKAASTFQAGDRIDFLCDFYSYSGAYQDSYMLGEQEVVEASELVVVGEPSESVIEGEEAETGGEWHPLISNTDVGIGAVQVCYCFTDLYGQEYWTPALRM